MTTLAPARSAPARPGFRPDLEGLRAVAVVLVLLFHAEVPGFGGGYVGVDVFYVLSGFLITGLLLREAERTGRVTLAAFYARRARRLLPAALLVLVVTLGASVLMLSPLRVPDVAADAAASALYVGNVRFAWLYTDYLQSAKEASPLLHYWSLGVEEQFYLVWPLLLLLATGRGPGLLRRVAVVAAGGTVVSLVLAVWLTGVRQPWAFFLLPTRAWELGIGALLAVGATRSTRLPDRVAAVLGWVGIGLVTASGVLLSSRTPYPGTAALLPTVGSALVIAGGMWQSRGGPGRWLSMPVPRFLGRISYSLYLWHWPVLLLPAAALGTALPWWAVGALLMLATVLATATQRWVEDPLRHGRWIGTQPRRSLVLALVASLAAAGIAGVVGARTAALLDSAPTTDLATDEADLLAVLADPPSTTPDGPVPEGLRPSLADSQHEHATPAQDGCHLTFGGVESGPCEYGDRDADRTVVLLGDSHALAWFPAVERLADEQGWRLLSLTKAACSPATLDQWADPLNRTYPECSAWRENTLTRVAEERPALVLVTGSDGFITVDDSGAPQYQGAAREASWRDGMTQTISRLQAASDQVVLIADVPGSQFDVPVCLAEHRTSTLACSTPLGQALDPDWFDVQQEVAAGSGATFVDPTRWVCPSEPCPAVIGAFLVLRDDHHLSPPFSRALGTVLGEELAGEPFAAD